MRLLSTLLLSLLCLVVVRGNAAEIAVSSLPATYEYRAAEKAVTNDALNDYFHIAATGNRVTNIAFQKEGSTHFAGSCCNNASVYIVSDGFENNCLFFSSNYAKSFRAKLIFPQHYHW
jgi:hypothetical protein